MEVWRTCLLGEPNESDRIAKNKDRDLFVLKKWFDSFGTVGRGTMPLRNNSDLLLPPLHLSDQDKLDKRDLNSSLIFPPNGALFGSPGLERLAYSSNQPVAEAPRLWGQPHGRLLPAGSVFNQVLPWNAHRRPTVVEGV